MIIYLIAFLVIAMIYHLLWENLAAPTWRMTLRFKLFALRDEVREFQLAQNSESLRALSADLESVLNNAIRLLHTATVSTILDAYEELQGNPDLLKKIEKRQAAIEEIPELKVIYDHATDAVASGFIANSGGWFLYLIPLFCAISSLGGLKRLLDKILSAKSYEIDAFEPELVYC